MQAFGYFLPSIQGSYGESQQAVLGVGQMKDNALGWGIAENDP